MLGLRSCCRWLLINIGFQQNLNLSVGALFIRSMAVVVHSLITFHRELQLAIRSARLKIQGSF